ncbi:PilT protein domain-containing protein [Salinisphaera sp. PC39]|uniref:type II toxin-antitoxin system VapC family toxin n=1 Tax=Salinisphaera sp. PC39 TaxID=1304156 RepID=UPI00333EF5E5
MTYLIDSDILLDVVQEDPEWFAWSADTLAEISEHGTMAINPIIYAEVSMGFERIEDMERVLPASDFRRLSLPPEAARMAGERFMRYRRDGGKRRSPMPNFLVGAHAAVAGLTLVTRDAGRFRTYFPSVTLVAPENE